MFFFFSYIKMFKNSNLSKIQRKALKNKLMKGVKTFLKKAKTKSDNMIARDVKIFQKMNNKS